ncbi:MAG: DUF1376 domain-containing protein [Hyphomicrobiales bacterium]|nr:MAG: DUF1376 domain-containing protein [Hyphomicrobiales bacterium]
MNHYPHHIGDFNTATRHLSRLERSIYRDMLDMYYDTERPLDGTDMSRLARRLCCTGDDELSALQFVLQEFFTREGDVFVHDRCERELAAFQVRQADKHVEQDNVRTRQQRHRQRRTELFAALREVGVVPSYKTKMPELERLCKVHCPIGESAGGDAGDGMRDGRDVTGDARHANATAIQNQNQNQLIPPNPPNGGTGADGDGSGQESQSGSGAAGPDPMALATALCGFFPVHRCTRLPEVASLLASLLADETVTGPALLDAASAQAAKHALNEGRACPSILRWLREQRWMDSAVNADATGSVDGKWSDTRSGIEAMGKRVGLPPYDDSGYRLLAQYEQEVRRRLQPDEVAA